MRPIIDIADGFSPGWQIVAIHRAKLFSLAIPSSRNTEPESRRGSGGWCTLAAAAETIRRRIQFRRAYRMDASRWMLYLYYYVITDRLTGLWTKGVAYVQPFAKES